jgi:major membrane immunogen (membrane-anchored lipoprotein)
MKKFGFAALLVLIGAAIAAAQTPADGFYFAQARQYSGGWRDQVVLRVQGGKITAANWNSVGMGAGLRDRDAVAAERTWSTWTARVEQALVADQNTNATAVTGVTNPVAPFFELVRAALAAGPVPKGIYNKDGWYYGEASAVDGFQTRNTVLITVVNGTIKDVLWNGILQIQGVDPSKIITSAAGKYPMTAPQGAWHLQATRAAAELVRLQNPASFTVKSDGTTDAITGVSIQVRDYLNIANRALQAAR